MGWRTTEWLLKGISAYVPPSIRVTRSGGLKADKNTAVTLLNKNLQEKLYNSLFSLCRLFTSTTAALKSKDTATHNCAWLPCCLSAHGHPIRAGYRGKGLPQRAVGMGQAAHQGRAHGLELLELRECLDTTLRHRIWAWRRCSCGSLPTQDFLPVVGVPPTSFPEDIKILMFSVHQHLNFWMCCQIWQLQYNTTIEGRESWVNAALVFCI